LASCRCQGAGDDGGGLLGHRFRARRAALCRVGGGSGPNQQLGQLDAAAYQSKRACWSEAIVAAIDREFPDFAAHVVASEFNTARSLATI
jgi:hypothetical protein